MPSAPLRLRCEHLTNPLGISAARPRLSWWVSDPRSAELQTGFEVLAASSLAQLDLHDGDLWRSGRIDSTACSGIEYQGVPLHSTQQVWWKVRTFDSDGLPSAWSEAAHFEMGLLSEMDWHGQWITTPLRGSRSRGVQVPALRSQFTLTNTPHKARLYVAALGDYRIEINGQPLPQLVSPAVWSDYQQQVYYQVLDVSAWLQSGDNAWGLLLGDGYYSGALGSIGRGNYGERPVVRAFLAITLGDRDILHVGTDQSWQWTPSWILGAEIHQGEHMDARRRLPGWSAPQFDTAGWAPVQQASGLSPALVAQAHPSLCVQQVLRPLNLPYRRPSSGSRVCLEYDFGTQLSGRLQAQLNSRGNDAVSVRYSLHDDFSQFTEDTYTSAPEPAEQTLEASFALHAFRFVRIEFNEQVTQVDQVLALRVAMPETGMLSFRSDHPSLNQLFEVVQNSLLNVAWSAPLRTTIGEHGLPDIAYAATWVPYYAQADAAQALVAKWLRDYQLDEQAHELPGPYVPRIPLLSSTAASDPLIRIEFLVHTVWTLYRHHDDRASLERFYPHMRAVLLAYQHHAPGLIREHVDSTLYGDGPVGSLVATAGLYEVVQLVARIAAVLNRVEDGKQLRQLAQRLYDRFRERFLTPDGYLVGDCQAAYTAALHQNLLVDEERTFATNRLVSLLQVNTYHPDLPPVLVCHILPVLTAAGRLDLAYMVLLQTSAPSWLANVNAGERLIGRAHGQFDIAEIGVMQWIMEALIGLRLEDHDGPEHNGYRTVHIQPRPPLGQQFAAGSPVQFIEAALQTVRGRFEVSWHIKPDCFELNLQVPPGCQAHVTLPDDIEQQVQSGQHRFVMHFEQGGDGVPILLDMAQDKAAG